jgi:hypothetical protein
MKKLFVVMVPVALTATVVVLGLAGIVRIPGLTPPKKSQKNAAALYGENDDKKVPAKSATQKPVAKKTEPAVTQPKAPPKTTDPELGAEALAGVWNEIKPPELARITKSWTEVELARVLTHMETGKVAKFLALLAKGDPSNKIDSNPARASDLSKKLQTLGSILPIADEGS